MAYKHVTLWKCLFSLVITVNVKQEIVIIFLIKLEAKKVMPTISDLNKLFKLFAKQFTHVEVHAKALKTCTVFDMLYF